MKLYRFVVTVVLFLSPAISLSVNKKGTLCWIICLFFFKFTFILYSICQTDTPVG